MRRRLSAREIVLLMILLVLSISSGYILLFYTPMTEKIHQAEIQLAGTEEQISRAMVNLEQKKRMEAELKELFLKDPAPVGIAPYDNLTHVMLELNSILEETEEYSLSFGTVDAKGTIVRRPISLRFTSPDYAGARKVLETLKDSDYRCMIDDLDISVSSGRDFEISVRTTLVFFEYRTSD